MCNKVINRVYQNKNIDAFFALLKAGLWEGSDVNLNDNIDWEKVYQLAEEQSVVGLVLAGIEHSRVKPPQEFLLQWIGEVQILEQRNQTMNQFIADLIDKLRREDVYALLLKGQGVAQCYEKPLWRCCGDVDLLLSNSNYQKAKDVLTPWASSTEPESIYGKHLGLTIDEWSVELHGTQHTELSSRIDKVIDEVQNDVFCGGNVRSWDNKGLTFLPSPDNDVIIIFTHFLKHFYKGGLGLRQICDWCRILYRYRSELDLRLLESRIKRMGLLSEWKAFAALAVVYLGMPSDKMPFYSADAKWKRKAELIQEFVMRVGNMGHNRDNDYYGNYPFVIRKCISFGRRISDVCNHIKIFPIDSIRFFPSMIFNGVRLAAKGVG